MFTQVFNMPYKSIKIVSSTIRDAQMLYLDFAFRTVKNGCLMIRTKSKINIQQYKPQRTFRYIYKPGYISNLHRKCHLYFLHLLNRYFSNDRPCSIKYMCYFEWFFKFFSETTIFWRLILSYSCVLSGILPWVTNLIPILSSLT